MSLKSRPELPVVEWLSAYEHVRGCGVWCVETPCHQDEILVTMTKGHVLCSCGVAYAWVIW